MNLNILLTLLIVATLAATYFFWVRPLLKATPSLGYLYADEERFWRAVSAKFVGIKQKIISATLAAVAFVVMAYDTLAPMVASTGVDVAKLAPMIPADAWPAIGFATIMLLTYFRHIGDKNAAANAAKLQSLGETLAAPAPVAVAPAATAPVAVTLDTPIEAVAPVPAVAPVTPIAFAPPGAPNGGNAANS